MIIPGHTSSNDGVPVFYALPTGKEMELKALRNVTVKEGTTEVQIHPIGLWVMDPKTV